MYQGEEVQEDGEDIDKGYNSYSMEVGKKKKGYLEGSNMDSMGMEQVYMEIEGFDRTEQVGLQEQHMNCGEMDFDKSFVAEGVGQEV